MPPKPLFIALLALASTAHAQVAQLQRCPSIADPTARLACYDAAMPPAIGRPAIATAPQAPSPAAAPAAAIATKSEAFGLPQEPATIAAQSIQSTTGATFYGWGPKERIRLQNGQVWEVTDGSSGTLSSPNTKVTVRKGALGGFRMEFEGLNRSPSVRRIE